MQKNLSEFKGFSLFDDINDKQLRSRNRAVLLANITEDNLTPNKRLTEKGTVLVLGYFTAIPEDERADVQVAYEQVLRERNFNV